MINEIDAFLIDQLKRHEGGKSKDGRYYPYKCSAGYLTGAIGRNLETNGISEAEAEFMLLNDLKNSAAELNKSFPWFYQLSLRRKQALMNLHFNIGLSKLNGFKKFLAAMSSGDYETASKELLDSAYARQVGKRADELAAQIRNG